jgi:hypothetical protein
VASRRIFGVDIVEVPSFFFFFFLPGGLLSKQGPRGARIRGAPLPHSHNALVTTPWLQEGQVRAQELSRNTDCLPLFSRGAVRATWGLLS